MFLVVYLTIKQSEFSSFLIIYSRIKAIDIAAIYALLLIIRTNDYLALENYIPKGFYVLSTLSFIQYLIEYIFLFETSCETLNSLYLMILVYFIYSRLMLFGASIKERVNRDVNVMNIVITGLLINENIPFYRDYPLSAHFTKDFPSALIVQYCFIKIITNLVMFIAYWDTFFEHTATFTYFICGIASTFSLFYCYRRSQIYHHTLSFFS